MEHRSPLRVLCHCTKVRRVVRLPCAIHFPGALKDRYLRKPVPLNHCERVETVFSFATYVPDEGESVRRWVTLV